MKPVFVECREQLAEEYNKAKINFNLGKISNAYLIPEAVFPIIAFFFADQQIVRGSQYGYRFVHAHACLKPEAKTLVYRKTVRHKHNYFLSLWCIMNTVNDVELYKNHMLAKYNEISLSNGISAENMTDFQHNMVDIYRNYTPRELPVLLSTRFLCEGGRLNVNNRNLAEQFIQMFVVNLDDAKKIVYYKKNKLKEIQ